MKLQNLSRASQISLGVIAILGIGIIGTIASSLSTQDNQSYGAIPRGTYKGTLTANAKVIRGGVKGDVLGSNNTIQGNVAGCLKGDNNIVAGRVTGKVIGIGNIVGGGSGRKPCLSSHSVFTITPKVPSPTASPAATLRPRNRWLGK